MRTKIILAAILLVLTSFLVGYKIGKEGLSLAVGNSGGRVTIQREVPKSISQNVNFSFFWRVWDTLGESYFDKSKLDPTKMTYGAIQGMVASIGDPYTVFLPPSENKITNEDLNGNFDGIGIQIGYKGTQLAVISPLPDSPAEKAGIKPGDYIIGIKDEAKKVERSTTGISLPEAVEIIRGKAGTKVTLSILRTGSDKPIIVDVTRKTINVPSVTLSFVDNSGAVSKSGLVAHIRLTKFGKETQGEWDAAVREILKRKEVDKIVLDLRNNPGGYLQGAVDIASDFLKTGSVVVIEQGSDGSKTEDKVTRLARLTDYKIVVLINGGSASASEILSGALRDNVRIKLVGETSFGKGTIQEPQELENGSGLHITIARWLTPSGIWVNEKGLEPDVKIEDDLETKEDEQLQKAIGLL